MKKVVQLYNDYFHLYKKNYNSKNIKDEKKKELDYNHFELTDNKNQGPKSTKKEETKAKKNLMKYKNHYW